MLVQFQNTDVVLYRLPDFSDGMLNSDDWNWTHWRQPTQLFTWSSKSQATPGPLFCCSMLNKQLLLKSELNIKRISWLGWGGICVTLCTTIITYSSGFPPSLSTVSVRLCKKNPQTDQSGSSIVHRWGLLLARSSACGCCLQVDMKRISCIQYLNH